MCRCKYPKFINRKMINITEDEYGERCYKITFSLGGQGSNILIISRAPRCIEKDSCDTLYKRIIKFLDSKKEIIKEISTITIVNLFTSYRYSKEDVYDEYLLNEQAFIDEDKDMILNNRVIEEAINEADYVIAGWGEPLGKFNEVYSNRVKHVLETLRTAKADSLKKKHVLRVGEVSTKGYPKHCLAWSYKDELQELFE